MTNSTNRIEDVRFMAAALERAMTQGIQEWSQDVVAWTEWYKENDLAQHVFAGTMLVSLFSYTEGRLGRFWWKKLRSHGMRRDLPILWKARNAFVHQDNRLEVNSHNSQQEVDDFRVYCERLNRGEKTDDKGNVFPPFLKIVDEEIRFGETSFHIFKTAFLTAFRTENMGLIP